MRKLYGIASNIDNVAVYQQSIEANDNHITTVHHAETYELINILKIRVYILLFGWIYAVYCCLVLFFLTIVLQTFIS